MILGIGVPSSKGYVQRISECGSFAVSADNACSRTFVMFLRNVVGKACVTSRTKECVYIPPKGFVPANKPLSIAPL